MKYAGNEYDLTAMSHKERKVLYVTIMNDEELNKSHQKKLLNEIGRANTEAEIGGGVVTHERFKLESFTVQLTDTVRLDFEAGRWINVTDDFQKEETVIAFPSIKYATKEDVRKFGGRRNKKFRQAFPHDWAWGQFVLETADHVWSGKLSRSRVKLTLGDESVMWSFRPVWEEGDYGQMVRLCARKGEPHPRSQNNKFFRMVARGFNKAMPDMINQRDGSIDGFWVPTRRNRNPVRMPW